MLMEQKLGRIAHLQGKAQAAQRAVQQSKQEVKAAQAAVVQVEAAHDGLTASVHRSAHDTAAAATQVQQQAEELRTLTRRRQAAEGAAAKRVLQSSIAQADALAALTAAAAEEQDAKFEEAAKLRGSLRASTGHQQFQATAAMVAEASDRVQAEMQSRRLDAVLSLKRSTEAAHAALAGDTAKAAAARQAAAEREAAAFESLAAQGHNPYLVFRKARMDRAFRKEQAEHADKVAARKLQVAGAVTQDELRRRRRAEAAQGGGDGARNQAANGQAGDEADAISAYLASVTRSGVDIVDVGGRGAAWEPSQVVDVKSAAFGLGKAHERQPEVLARIAAQPVHAGVQPDTRGAPAKLPHPDAAEPGSQADDPDAAVLTSTAFSSEDARRVLQARALSRLEERLMGQAKERQRKALTQRQVVMGKEYMGDGFMPSPTTLHFKDFDVGRQHTLTLTLTNVSLSFNSFRLLSLPDDIVDFFDVSYTRPGRMSAGTACKVTVTFTPRLNKDIHAELVVLAQTGKLTVPLTCTCKKALPHIDEPVVDLGDIMLGESGSASLTLRNAGAIPVPFRLLPPPTPPGQAEAECPFTFNPSGTIGGYAAASVKFSLSPEAGKSRQERDACIGPVSAVLDAHFDAPGANQSLRVLVKANITPEPLRLEQESIPIGLCPVGKAYRISVVAVNKGPSALKCNLRVPPALLDGDIVSLQPSMAYVQGTTTKDNTFKYSVVFRPPPDMAAWESSALARFVTGRSSANGQEVQVQLPITLHAPDQALPVFGTITARLTTGSVSCRPRRLDFGSVPIGAAVTRHLTLTNSSALPVQLGAADVPPSMRLGSTDGIFVLLPGEQRDVPVVFAPADPRPLAHSFSIQSTMGDSHSVHVTGAPFKPALRLSLTSIAFPSMCLGQQAASTLHVTNTSTVPQQFRVLVPPPATGLHVAPHTCRALEPGASLPLRVQFSPTEHPPAPGADTSTERSAHPDSAALSGGALLSPGAIPGTPHPTSAAMFQGVCHVQYFVEVQGRGGEDEEWGSTGCIPVSVTSTLLPEVISLSSTTLDFMALAVGSSKAKTVDILNHSDVPIDVLVEGVPSGGGFSLVSVPTRLPAQGRTSLSIEFSPTSHRTYLASLSVRAASGGAPCPLHLTGRGLSPQLTVTPSDGQLAFGHVLTGVTHRLFAEVRNESAFSVPFKVSQRVRGDRSGFGAGMRFAIQPEQGMLEPGAAQKFAITFFAEAPTCQQVSTDIHVAVPQQPDTFLDFSVTAFAWSTPLFAFVGEESAPTSCTKTSKDALRVQCKGGAEAKHATLHLGCVTRCHELQDAAASKSKGGAVHLKLPEPSVGVSLERASFELADGECVAVPLHGGAAAGSEGAAARPDGTVQMMQFVTIKGAAEFLPATDPSTPDGVSQSAFWAPLVVETTMPL